MGQKPKNSRPPQNVASHDWQSHPWVERPATQEFWKTLVISLALVLAVFLVFGQTSQHEFLVCDDVQYIYGNPHVASGLSWENVQWALTTCHAGNWHPLTWMSHMLDATLYPAGSPGAPGGHHLTNVWLHAASVVILFLALRQMTGALWCSALVAAMFAIHPLRAESVAWAAERKDVLSGLFWMLTLWSYSWYARRPSLGRYASVVVSFGLGLTAKSMLVTLPCVLLLLDYWPMRRWRPKGVAISPEDAASPRFPVRSLGWLVVEKLPLLALSLSVSAIVAAGQHGAGAMSMMDPILPGMKVANAIVSYVVYLWKTVWPVNLAIFYPHPSIVKVPPALWAAETIGSAVLLLAITAWALWNWRRWPCGIVGWLWYLGTLVPVIGLIQIGAHAYADRYTYLPMIGVYMVVVWGAADWSASRPAWRTALGCAAGATLVLWLFVAYHQTAQWKNNLTVFGHAVEVTRDNYFAYNHLGVAYQELKEPEKAGQNYAEAVRIAPNYDSASGNLGIYYAGAGQLERALPYLKNAARINPFVSVHHSNLGAAYLRLNRLDEAAAAFHEALRRDPENPSARVSLIQVFYRQGKIRDMLDQYREILRLRPNEAAVMNELAWFLATYPDPQVRNGKEALDLAGRAVQLTAAQEPVALHTLAAAYAENGRFSEAQQAIADAIDLAKRQGKQKLIAPLEAEAKQYQRNMPLRVQPSKIISPKKQP
ncbi:MAG: tetratricopeptide repeat protein [Thermoguttaceae bacterium]